MIQAGCAGGLLIRPHGQVAAPGKASGRAVRALARAAIGR